MFDSMRHLFNRVLREKTRKGGLRSVWSWLLIFCSLQLFHTCIYAQSGQQVSTISQYRGYSEEVYSEWARTSQYVTVRDGTRLALDIFRPVRDGKPVEEPLPVIWTYDRYHRATLHNGRLVTQLDGDPWLIRMLRHGYVIGVADGRGTGASFGTWQGPFTQKEAYDGYDITEWFAAQSWCNKRVGMYGRSYLGITQYIIASTAPPHLKAIFPEMAMFDLYSFAYGGGVFRHDFATNWNRMVTNLDVVSLAAPVDDDKDGSLLRAAAEEHKSNKNIYEMFAALPHRDSVDREANNKPYFSQSPSRVLKELNKSGVPVYHLTGWNDLWTKDALLWFNNLSTPQKLIIAPSSHGTNYGLDLGNEHLRWYDHWLKGIDNKIMDEASIHYYTMGAPPGQEWRSTSQWPLANQQPTSYYFQEGATGDAGSRKDQLLSTQPPAHGAGADDYTVDYSTTSGTESRWANGYGAKFNYGDMARNDAKGLTYTSQPLTTPVEVTGHPLVRLWINSTAKDADLFVYLEEVHPGGASQYVTEGVLRASHRATVKPPYNYMNLPYHRSFKEDTAELTDEPVELHFDLLPTSNIFDAGNRIRITITGADKDNFTTPQLNPPPALRVFRNSTHASSVLLPVIPIDAQTAAALMSRAQPSATAAAAVEPPTTSRASLYLIIAGTLIASGFIWLFIKLMRKRGSQRR
jgi:putative CocE/NonD family hydrolase